MDSASKPKAHAIGAEAELLAQTYLQTEGYQILHTNYSCARGEIDCIAIDGGVLCFVEVRARASTEYGHPLETIGRQKQRRIIHAASDYVDNWVGELPAMRFDALGIVLSTPAEFVLVKEAFEA